VVTKLDRLARSWPTRAIAGELTTRQIILSLGGSVDDPTDAVGRLLFNVPVMVAEVAEQFGVGRSTLNRASSGSTSKRGRPHGGDIEAVTPLHGAGRPVSDTPAEGRRLTALGTRALSGVPSVL